MTSADFESDLSDLEPGVPAAPGSPLEGLRARREAARDALHLDLRVPRYEPPVYVRYRPLNLGHIDALRKRAEKSKAKDAIVAANAALLAGACVGVFEYDGDQAVSIDPSDRYGDWPKFDARLAELLGVKATRAADVVRELFCTDGDIMSTMAQLSEWSGFNDDELDEEFEGN